MAKKRQLRVLVIKAGEPDISKFTTDMKIDDDLDAFYSAIGCDYIEIPERKIGGKVYNIICDEEGLLKDNQIPSCRCRTYPEIIMGNVIICGKSNNAGNLTSLTDGDIANIRNHIQQVSVRGAGRLYVIETEV